MSNKAVAIGVTASVLAILASTVILVSYTKAYPGEPEDSSIIPTVDDILATRVMGELSIYYNYIGHLYLTGQIDEETYAELYQAYATRFHQLIGGSE